MTTLRRAQFQEAAVRHIVSRFKDPAGSKRVLLADEVGLGKTVVARGVIERLLERRRSPLTVIYLCSNSEIAEQNRTKLDPDSAAPVGRVTELAFESKMHDASLRLYSFTPGTSLKDGTGLEWEQSPA
jgi:type I site-specific restriction endonuclease